jgi:DNA-binding response OmpR family regulator
MRLLVAEHDDLLGAAVQSGLVRSGYAVDWVRAGRDALTAARAHDYDACVLDLCLPDITGEGLLKVIRHESHMPIVVAAAHGAVHECVSLLDAGADDYVVKPVDLRELEARLRALTRRASAVDYADAELDCGALRLMPSRHAVMWHGEGVRLTKKEYRLLEYFVRKKHQVLTRAQLEDTLYGWGDEVCSNAVEVYIHALRRKFFHGLIETVRGVGYKLAPPAGFEARPPK